MGVWPKKNSIWKHHSWNAEVYTEFDFLAVLDDFRMGYDIKCSDCASCVDVTREAPTEHQSKNREDFRMETDRSFWKEINLCSVVSSCEGIALKFDKNPDMNSQYVNPENHGHHRCDKCIVEMRTGYLRINTKISLHRGFLSPYGSADCSLVFLWISKTKVLFSSDRLLLQKTQPINQFSVYVDFLPAFELFKQDGDVTEHECFLVPKSCKVCHARGNWKKIKL